MSKQGNKLAKYVLSKNMGFSNCTKCVQGMVRVCKGVLLVTSRLFERINALKRKEESKEDERI